MTSVCFTSTIAARKYCYVISGNPRARSPSAIGVRSVVARSMFGSFPHRVGPALAGERDLAQTLGAEESLCDTG